MYESLFLLRSSVRRKSCFQSWNHKEPALGRLFISDSFQNGCQDGVILVLRCVRPAGHDHGMRGAVQGARAVQVRKEGQELGENVAGGQIRNDQDMMIIPTNVFVSVSR